MEKKIRVKTPYLIKLVADETGCSRKDIGFILRVFIRTIRKELLKGNLVSLRGFLNLFIYTVDGRDVFGGRRCNKIVAKSNSKSLSEGITKAGNNDTFIKAKSKYSISLDEVFVSSVQQYVGCDQPKDWDGDVNE